MSNTVNDFMQGLHVKAVSVTVPRLVKQLVCLALERGWRLDDVTVRLHQEWDKQAGV